MRDKGRYNEFHVDLCDVKTVSASVSPFFIDSFLFLPCFSSEVYQKGESMQLHAATHAALYDFP